MNSVDFVLQMNQAKDQKYKELYKMPKKAIMFLGRPEHFPNFYTKNMEWKTNKLQFKKEDDEKHAAEKAGIDDDDDDDGDGGNDDEVKDYEEIFL